MEFNKHLQAKIDKNLELEMKLDDVKE